MSQLLEIKMSNRLTQLRSMTSVVADTGDMSAIEIYRPDDATTNPSLVLKQAQTADGRTHLAELVAQECVRSNNKQQLLSQICDKYTVLLGSQIASIVPGKISTEVDARLSFDTDAMVRKGEQLIALYDSYGVAKERVLIKLAATWEGIQAAIALEKQGIGCNLTLIFSHEQAKACADAGVTLISPFVGRVTDWYKQNTNYQISQPADDPGVIFVSEIFDTYKSQGYDTIIMGASFRNTGQIAQLAGCDKLTISPALLRELESETDSLHKVLDKSAYPPTEKTPMISAGDFRLGVNQNTMAADKLSSGIRDFVSHQLELEKIVSSILQ